MDMIQNLMNGRIHGALLPSQKFFNPTVRFLRWMKRQYPSAVIYDVGSGLGHVAQALFERGLKVLALDLHFRESREEYPVVIVDGESYEYESGSVVMLCRPCHGQFSEEVISQAVRCNAAVVLYVGLDRNVDDDLGVFREQFTKTLSQAGEDGETVWRLSCDPRNGGKEA